MLRDPKIWATYERIILVHGVRYLTDLAYTEELDEHHEAYPGRLVFIPVVSRALAVQGFQGRITQAIEGGQLEDLTGTPLSPENSAVMMCGNPQMLDDVEALLNARGMRKHKRNEPGHYVVERYW
jgi:ferredoxin--NADP+ reductase